MLTVEEYLAEMERKYSGEATPVTATIEQYGGGYDEVDDCNAYITVTTPNRHGGVDTLQGLYAFVEDGMVHYTVDTGWGRYISY